MYGQTINMLLYPFVAVQIQRILVLELDLGVITVKCWVSQKILLKSSHAFSSSLAF